MSKLPHGPTLQPGEQAVEMLETKSLFKAFRRIDGYTLRSRKFNGQMSEPYEREVFGSAHSDIGAMILPYDPVRDAVVLIEQFRLPVYLSGRTNGWTLEIVGGLIESGDEAEATARRETLEETGRTIGRLARIGHYLPSPCTFREVIHLFVGEVTAGAGGEICGLAAEDEDIRSHVISFDEAVRMADNDEIDNANTLLAINWLARHRERLRAEWLKPPVV